MIKKVEEKHIIKSFVYMHNSSLELAAKYLREEKRQVFITPSMFIDLITSLKQLYGKLKAKFEKKNSMYTNGVDKIIETQRSIDIMKDGLEKKKPELVEMNKKLAELQVELDAVEAELKPVYERVRLEEARVKEEFEKAEVLRIECEAELRIVDQILDNAKEAIKTISASQLYDVKSYQKPPQAVKMVMSAICIIFNKKPETDREGNQDYWKASKEL